MGGSDDQQSANGDGELRTSSLLDQLQGRISELGEAPPGELITRVWAFQNDLYVAALAGEMDMSNAAELTRVLDGQLGPGPCELIIDLSQLTFIDSSGINELLKVTKTLKGSGGEIVLVAPTTVVARVLDIVQIDEFAPVAESLEVALAHVTTRTNSTPTRLATTASRIIPRSRMREEPHGENRAGSDGPLANGEPA